jgi:hypothetical protein
MGFSNEYRLLVRQSSVYPQVNKLTAKTHDCMEKVRPGNGRETGLGRAGVRAPKVGTLGDAWSNCRKNAEKFFSQIKHFASFRQLLHALL